MAQTIFTTKTIEQSITVENATLTFLGYEKTDHTYADKGLPQMLHTHAYAELFFCKKGEFVIKYNNTEQKLSEGDIVFIPPKITHYKHSGSADVYVVAGMTLKKKSGSENFNTYRKLQKLFSATEPVFFRRFSPIFPDEMSWIDEITSTSPLLALLSGFHTILKLASKYKDHSYSDSDMKNDSKKLNILMQLENFIDGKYYENITADELSGMLYISPRHLARIVKERYGEPLHQVITKKRIESAAKLLLESNLSVEEISSFVGFSTKSCFYRAFRNEYNMTPLQYKKQSLK